MAPAVLRHRWCSAMPTKHRPLRRDWHRQEFPTVTAEMLALWRAGKAIRNKDSDAFKDAERALQQACGLSKFAASVLSGHGHLLSGLEKTDLLAKRWRQALEHADCKAAGE
jgi:hypothetical protein